ncbi:MAG TPA: prepilin-type N-terminal cleavage/methylation domain-containing protein [Trueperaceae bacterium]
MITSSFRDSRGLTILEVLVALSVIAIAFLALAMAQITNLKATVRTQAITELKAAANVVLEEKMSDVLRADSYETEPAAYDLADEYEEGMIRYLRFWFLDYYYGCSSRPVPSGLRALDETVVCYDEDSDRFENIEITWQLKGREQIEGEGLLDIIVTATHDSGSSLTIGDVVSCYAVYPSPSSEVPMPCPEPADPNGVGG